MKSRFVVGFIVLLVVGVFVASLAKGKDLEIAPKNNIFHDYNRDTQIEVTFYKRVAHLSGKNFGNELKLSGSSENIYKNEKNNLTLLKKDDETIIFIGKKKVFEGELQKDNSYKKITKSNLVSNVWLWQNLIIKEDNSLKPKNPNIFNLSFSKNGKISATTDCADFAGEYALRGNEIVVLNLIQEKEFCDNSEGEEFIRSLYQVNSFDFDADNNLTLFLKDNSGSMSFVKK